MSSDDETITMKKSDYERLARTETEREHLALQRAEEQRKAAEYNEKIWTMSESEFDKFLEEERRKDRARQFAGFK